MLTSFSAKNYRNLHIPHISFQKINLLVGPNNSGKTNFLQAFHLFPEIMMADTRGSALYQAVGKRGGDDLLNRKVAPSSPIELTWRFDLDEQNKDAEYHLQFQVGEASPVPNGATITEEKWSMTHLEDRHRDVHTDVKCQGATPGKASFMYKMREDGKLLKSTFNTASDIQASDLLFRQMDTVNHTDHFHATIYPKYKTEVDMLEDYFSKFLSCASADFDRKTLLQSRQVDLTSRTLHSDASNLVNVLSYLDDKYDFLDTYTKALQPLIPKLDKLKIKLVSQTKRELRVFIDGHEYKLYEMSVGTVQAMILALLLHTPERMTLLSLDEPELHLHPTCLTSIATWMVETKSADQLFISTHSADLLDGFTEAFRAREVGLYVCGGDDDQTIKEITPDALANASTNGWKLGDVYRVGAPLIKG